MGTYSRFLLLTARRQTRLSTQLRTFHIHGCRIAQCPGCQLERAMERQVQMADC